MSLPAEEIDETPETSCSRCEASRLVEVHGNARGALQCTECGRLVAEALVDLDSRYEDDVACQLFVSAFPGGATMEEVAEALGISRQRVQQIEMAALLKAKMRADGATEAEIREALQEMDTRRGGPVEPEPYGED